MQGYYFLIFVRYRLLAESQWALLVFIRQLLLLFSPLQAFQYIFKRALS